MPMPRASARSLAFYGGRLNSEQVGRAVERLRRLPVNGVLVRSGRMVYHGSALGSAGPEQRVAHPLAEGEGRLRHPGAAEEVAAALALLHLDEDRSAEWC